MQKKNFFTKIITAGSGISSKRLMGVLCILFAMVYAVLGLVLGEEGNIDGTVSGVLIEFLTAGVALFGVTAWEKSKIRIDKQDSTEYIYENNIRSTDEES